MATPASPPLAPPATVIGIELGSCAAPGVEWSSGLVLAFVLLDAAMFASFAFFFFSDLRNLARRTTLKPHKSTSQIYLYIHCSTCMAFNLPFLHYGETTYVPMQARALHSSLGRLLIAYVAAHDFIASPFSAEPEAKEYPDSGNKGIPRPATHLTAHPLMAVAALVCLCVAQFRGVDFAFPLFCWLLVLVHIWAIRTDDQRVAHTMHTSPQALRVNLFPAVAPILSASSLWLEGICGSYLTFAVWRLVWTYYMGNFVVEGRTIRFKVGSWPTYIVTSVVSIIPIVLTSALCCDPLRVWYAFQRFLLNWVVLVVAYFAVKYADAMSGRAMSAVAWAKASAAAPMAMAVLMVLAAAAFDYGVITIALDGLRSAE